MKDISTIMALWLGGFLSDDEVVKWADKRIAESRKPPMELIELSVRGPKECSKFSASEFPLPREFSLREEFLLLAATIDQNNQFDLEDAVSWLASESMGGDLSDEIVALGYEIDDLKSDCGDMSMAKSRLLDSIHRFMPEGRSFMADILRELKVEQVAAGNGR